MGQTSFIRKNFRVDERTFSKVRSIIELWHGRPVAVLIRLVYDAGLGNISESTLQRIARCQTYQEYRELAAEARKTRPARREAEDEMTDEERDEAVTVNEREMLIAQMGMILEKVEKIDRGQEELAVAVQRILNHCYAEYERRRQQG